MIEYYNDHSGDISHILEEIICSENSDVTRFIEFYESCFKNGTLQKTKRFDTSKVKIVLLPDEKAEAKKGKKKIKQQ